MKYTSIRKNKTTRKKGNTMNVMLDLETMGTSPNAPIVAIGAVKFSLEDLTIDMEDTFYRQIYLPDIVDMGAQICPYTVLWWLKQDKAAIEQTFLQNDPDEGAYGPLCDFAAWLPEKAKVWGNGSDFDNVLLAETYKRIGEKVPWRFFNNRCYRTVKKLYPQVELKREGTHHNALSDAISQAKHLIEIWRSNEKST